MTVGGRHTELGPGTAVIFGWFQPAREVGVTYMVIMASAYISTCCSHDLRIDNLSRGLLSCMFRPSPIHHLSAQKKSQTST